MHTYARMHVHRHMRACTYVLAHRYAHMEREWKKKNYITLDAILLVQN